MSVRVVAIVLSSIFAITALPSIRFRINPFANKEVPSDFRTVEMLLVKELRTNKLYSRVWEEAKWILQIKELKLLNAKYYFNPTTPRVCYLAIIAYTLDLKVFVDGEWLKLFKDFNEKFRQLTDESSWEEFPYKSLYYLIQLALPGVREQPTFYSTLYRGIKGHIDPKPRKGDIFYFDSFASCTTDKVTAEEFAGIKGTLIIIEVDDDPIVACGVDAYSKYDEDEVLVFPNNKFRVVRFDPWKDLHVLTLDIPDELV